MRLRNGGRVEVQWPAAKASASWCASSTTAPEFRRRSFASASSIRSSPRNPWGREPAWASTSCAAWLNTTTATSKSTHKPGRTEFRVALPIAEPGRRGASAMNKPVLFIVDDDPQVLAAVRRDLRSRYRENYTVMSAASGEEALNAMRELKSRGDSLAMLICDQRMPGMMGSEVLAKSRAIYPLARRVLLTAYSDIEAADQGHQRSASRSLSLQALGAARGSPVSCCRRSARRLAGRVSA